MKQARTSILTVLNVVSFVGIFFCLSIGQISFMFVCIGAFLIAFLTAIQMTPSKATHCPSCGYDLTQSKIKP